MLDDMLGGFHVWHWLIVLAVVFVLFAGRGSIEQFMNDFARGISENARGDEIFQAATGKLNRWLVVVAVVLAAVYVAGSIVLSVWP